MKKIIFLLALFLTTMTNPVYAGLKSEINSVIVRSGINKSSISVSVKNAYSGKVIYELNPKMPVPPASAQKIITATPAFLALGKDYKFSTKLYKTNKNEYVIKLGADPYLNSKDLDKIVKSIPKEPACIKIDSTVIDDNEWGEGWQWDDCLNPYMPKFSAYNLDKNLMEITIIPSMIGYPAQITQNVSYPLTFINKTKTDKNTNYSIKTGNTTDVLIIDGTIKYNRSEIVNIPISNLKKYFKMKLSEAIINNAISSSGIYEDTHITKNDKLITLLSHDIKQAKKDIYKNSNNYIAETVFKLGGRFKDGEPNDYDCVTGSFQDGLEMFYKFCKSHNLDYSNIRIVDASGVSKNNLMTADFMTSFLLKTQGFLEPELPTAGEGTLSKRMLYLKGFIHAKTGTLCNVSTMAGYIVTQKKQKYVFTIMINNSDFSAGDKKMLEEYILRTIYAKG